MTRPGFIAFLILLFSLPASGQIMPPDPEVEALWKDFQSIEDAASQRMAIEPDDLVRMINSALSLQVEAEYGKRQLNPVDSRRLDALVEQAPKLALSEAMATQAERDDISVSGSMATISGTVSEAGTGTLVTTGTVEAIPFGNPFRPNAASGQIQGDGSYSIDLEPGHYVLHFTGTAEYIRQAWPDIECVYQTECNHWYGGERIEVDADDELTRDFSVERGIRIQGNVSDENGDAVEGATVNLSARRVIGSGVGNNVTTDEFGNYETTTALPPDSYRIFVTPPPASGLLGRVHDGQRCLNDSNDCGNILPDLLTIDDTSAPQTFDFNTGSGLHLTTGSGLSGQVFEEDGSTPLEEAVVQVVSTDGIRLLPSTTNASGEYEFEVLPEDDYFVVAFHPSRLAVIHPDFECFSQSCDVEVGTPVSLGVSDEFLDFSLSAGATVSGQVLRESDGAPLEDVLVAVGNSIQGYANAQPNEDGEFTVEGLPEGVFYVSAAPGGMDPDILDLQITHLGDITCPINFCPDHGQPINVPESGDVTGLTIQMPVGGGLTGQMFDAETGLPLTAIMAPRLELWVASGPFKGELAQTMAAFSINPAEEGIYTARGLSPGAYKATFGSSTHLGLIDTAFGGQPCPRGSCNHDDLPTVFVTAGTMLSDIGATLPRGPIISGQVLDADTGEPPPPPVVHSGTRLMSFYGTSGNYASFSDVEGDGRFSSRTGFPADTFFAATYTTRNDWSFEDGYIDQAYDGLDCPRLKCNLTASATAIDVVDTDIEGIELALRQGGRISGTITDVNDASPLAGIQVEAYNSAGQVIADAVTNPLGEYTLESLPGGEYTLRTRNRSGYQNRLYDGIACAPFCNPANGTPVTVTEEETQTDIDFALVRAVSISGTVTLDGTPIENITVEVYGALGNLIDEVMSASDGSYAFTSLSPGEYHLRTRNTFGHADTLHEDRPCVGDACRVRQGDRIQLSAGQEQTIDLDLMPGATLSGEVHDRSDPDIKLSGVTVQLLDDRGAVAFEATTGSGGQFSFNALAAGEYHLVTRQTPDYIDQTLGGAPCSSVCNGLGGDVITVTAGDSHPGNDMDLAPGAAISGNVQAGGSPVVGAQAAIYNDGGQPVTTAPTNASGNFEIGNLPDGDYFVRVGNVPGFVSQLFDGIACSGFCDVLNGDVVSITDNSDVGSINFSLVQGGSIAGTVTSAGSALPGVEVVAFDSAGFIAGQAVTNASGQYTIQGLVDGSYRLRTTNTGGFIDKVYEGDTCSPNACVVSDGSGIAVAGATVGGIDFSLEPGASISGTATDPFGNPLPDGTAVLLDSTGLPVTSTAISDGLWSFDGLSEGTYYLLIENNLGLVDELFDDVPCPGGSCDITGLGTPITIGDSGLMTVGERGGSQPSIDVVLDEGSAISGQVTDADSGAPLVGVVVYFFDADGNKVGASSPTDGLGEYQSAGGLPEGNYFVATASGSQRGFGGNYINAVFDGGTCMLDCDVTQGTPVETGSDNIDLALSQGAGVRGRVTGPDGDNLVQVDVRVFDADGFLAGTIRTDSQGRYQIDGLAAGEYFAHTTNNLGLDDVSFGDTACEDTCQPLEGDSFSVGTSGFTKDIDFQLKLTDELFSDRFELD